MTDQLQSPADVVAIYTPVPVALDDLRGGSRGDEVPSWWEFRLYRNSSEDE